MKMDKSSSKSGRYKQGGGDERLKKLEKENYDIHLQLSNLQEQNSAVKQFYTLALQNSEKEKKQIEEDAKEKEKFITKRDEENKSLRCMYTAVVNKHDEIKAKFESLCEKFKNKAPVKRSFSETQSSQDSERVSKLEENIAWKRRKLTENYEKIKKLENDVKCYRENYNAKSFEVVELQKELREVKAQLGSANRCVLEKEREISECHATVNKLKKDDEEKDATIKHLEDELKEWKDKHASQQSVIDQQTQYIEELEEEQVKLVGSCSFEETERLREKCRKYSLKIDKLASDFEEAEEMVRKQIEINDHNEAVVKTMRREKRRLWKMYSVAEEKSKNLKTEHEQVLKFVESIISCSEFPKNEQQTTLGLLEMLEAHIRNKMSLLNKFCDLMHYSIQESERSSSVKPPTNTDTQKHTSTHQPTTPHIFLAPLPPPPKAPSFSSVVPPLPSTLPSKPISSPNPPPQELSQETTIDVIDLTQGDDFYNELMSNVNSELPSTSKQSQREMAKGTTFTSQAIRHAEDVKRRIGGQGPDNVGAKFYCICKFECNTQLQLEHHIKYAVHEGKFECPVCMQRFWKFGFWKSHIKSTHSNPEALDIEKYTCGCQSCGEMFETAVSKKRHHCHSASGTTQNVVSVTDENAVDVNMRTPPETNASLPETTAVMENDEEQDYVDVEAFSPLVLLTT